MFDIEATFPMKVDWLKSNSQLVHYFGLGFIQLKINQEYRMHFYTPELPSIIPEKDVHNHRYDFISRIVKGILIQELYNVLPNEDTHIMEEESCQSGVKCETTSIHCGIKLMNRATFFQGSQYWIDHDVFHRVTNDGECITLLRRTDYKKRFAKVIRKKGSTPICPFSQKVEEEKLWCIIERMISV